MEKELGEHKEPKPFRNQKRVKNESQIRDIEKNF